MVASIEEKDMKERRSTLRWLIPIGLGVVLLVTSAAAQRQFTIKNNC